jgi:universal stress protein E
MSLDKIMVIIDPTTTNQPAFERALHSAQLTGARLHLYTCIEETDARETDEHSQQECLKMHRQLINGAQEHGIDVSGEVEIGRNWNQQVVSAAARCTASMVFKGSKEHSDVEREMRETSDWTLLRLSPCPVLLVKDFHDWKNRRVLAAINTRSPDIAHIKLNSQIISFAQQFSDAYGADAHFINAYSDRNHVPDDALLADSCGVPRAHIHVVEGSAADVIASTAADIDADLIIIGTVGRAGLKGTVVGNTSERILDHTHSDVLVLN